MMLRERDYLFYLLYHVSLTGRWVYYIPKPSDRKLDGYLSRRMV